MPDVANVQIEGLDKVLKKLDTKKYAGPLKAMLLAGGQLIKNAVATYPPETEANQPRSPGTVFSIKGRRAVNHWYVRGLGTVTTSGKVYKTSEDLGNSWTLAQRESGRVVEVGNRVSYGPVVQGSRQAGFHAARGWKTIFQVAKEQAPIIGKMMWVTIQRLLAQ